jgi:FkbM family methyltransferase
MDKKKILLVVPHLSTGGLPQFAVKKIEMLKNAYEIKCVEYSCISHDFIVQRNKIISLIGGENLITLEENKTELLKWIESFSPDVVWMEEFPEFFMDRKIANSIYSAGRKYAIVETTHDSSFKASSKIWMPDKFFFVSVHNALTFYNLGIPYEVIEYPVDRKQVNKSEAMKKLGLDPGWKHVVNVGLFTPRKNQGYVFDLARSLFGSKIKFHFLGNQADNFRSYWEPLMKDKPDNCIIWGERDDVDTFLEAADLFVFSSRGDRNNKELNPLSIKEALSNSLPVAMFDLDVYCGKYADNGDVHFLSGSIEGDSQKILSILEYNDDLSDNITVSYNMQENQINISNISDSTLSCSVVVRDLLSGHTVYVFNADFNPGSNYWCKPCPPDYFVKIFNSNNFSGYEIDFYNRERQKILFSKTIVIDEHACNFDRTIKNNPFNCSYINYIEFFVKRYLDDFNVTERDVFIDAGANDGLVTEWALKKGFKKVYSIEPDKRAISFMKDKFIDEDRVVIVEKALYDVNKYDVRFSTKEETSTVTSIDSFEHSNLPSENHFLAETVRFSRFINDYNIENISVFKVDIEGAEYNLMSDIPKDWILKIKHFLIELHWVNPERIDLIIDLLGDNFHLEFRDHLSDNIRVSLDDAKKLQMVTLFATNRLLVKNFEQDPKINIIPKCCSRPGSIRETVELEAHHKLIQPNTNGEKDAIPMEDLVFNEINEKSKHIKSGSKVSNKHSNHIQAILSCDPCENTAYLFFDDDVSLTVDPDFFKKKVEKSYRISRKKGYRFFSYCPLDESEFDLGDHLTSKSLSSSFAYMIPGEKIGYIQEIIKSIGCDSLDDLLLHGMLPQRFGYFDDRLCRI